MHRDDLMELLMAWVIGQCYQHVQQTKLFDKFQTYQDAKFPGFNNLCAEWVQDTQNKVWRAAYHNDSVGPNYNDFQAEIATKARILVKNHLS